MFIKLIFIYKARLFVLFCHNGISQTRMFHVAFLVFLESFWRLGVHQLGLKLFGTMTWKLLNIEPFFQWKLSKLKTKNCIEIWGHLWCCWKTLGEIDLITCISQFLELRCERHWFLSGFCCWKFKQLQKSVGKKN